MNMWKTLNKGIMKAFGMNIETDTATLNDESFLEWVGIKRDSESKNPTADVTYFTCLKMMSETVAKMPWKLYQNPQPDSLVLYRKQTQSRKNTRLWRALTMLLRDTKPNVWRCRSSADRRNRKVFNFH